MIHRSLAAATLAFVLPAASQALSVILPSEPGSAPIWTKSEIIKVTIKGPVAETTLSDVFHNPTSRQAEGTLVMTLPRDAEVTDFEMVINGVKTRPEVIERGKARQIYEDIVRRAKDPGLLELMDNQTIKVRVFPIPPDGDIPVTIRFSQPLHREGKLYAFEFDPGTNRMQLPAGNSKLETDLSLDLQWSAALGTIYSPTHKLSVERTDGERTAHIRTQDWKGSGESFTLYFAPRDSDLGVHLLAHRPTSEGEGHFLLMIHPPESGDLSTPVAKDVTFVIDVSGSMAEDDKIGQARKALAQCLGALGREDSFNIISFSTDVHLFRPNPVPASEENLKAGRTFASDLAAIGGTAIDDALQAAMKSQPKDERLHQIVFLTDGLPTVGNTDPDTILRNVKTAGDSNTRIFSLGVGYDVNARLIDQIADNTRAVSTYVTPGESIELKVGSLWDAVGYPVLTDLEMSFSGAEVRDVYPRILPDLFRGRDLVVAGSYKGAGAGAVTLKGTAKGKPYKHVADVSFPEKTETDLRYVSALWARRKVGYLLDEIRLHGESSELKDEVISLAKQYNLVTPYTSYLIVEDSRQPSQPLAQGPPSPAEPRPDLNLRNFTLRKSQGAASPRDRMAADAPAMELHDSLAPATANSPSGQWQPNAFSGRAAVQSAQTLREEKEASSAPAESGSGNFMEPAPALAGGGGSDAGMIQARYVSGRRFILRDTTWVEDVKATPDEVVQVKYLSDAYFRVLEKFPKDKAAITLGESVQLVLDGKWVQIGNDGAAAVTALPAAWR